MIEDPRDKAPAGEDAEADAEAEEAYSDEISIDELEGDTTGFFSASGLDPGATEPAPRPFPDVGDQDVEELGDEVSLDELDNDTAGFFEVYATPAPPEPEVDDDSVYEVQAERAPDPQPQRAAPSPPPQASASPTEPDNIRRLHNVEVEVIATLGTTRMQIRDILGLQVGSVVELHRMVGEPVDVTLNGRLIARGEVVVVDEKFAIRVHEIAGNGE